MPTKDLLKYMPLPTFIHAHTLTPTHPKFNLLTMSTSQTSLYQIIQQSIKIPLLRQEKVPRQDRHQAIPHDFSPLL